MQKNRVFLKTSLPSSFWPAKPEHGKQPKIPGVGLGLQEPTHTTLTVVNQTILVDLLSNFSLIEN